MSSIPVLRVVFKPRCEWCGNPVCVYEGEAYCVDCTRWDVAADGPVDCPACGAIGDRCTCDLVDLSRED